MSEIKENEKQQDTNKEQEIVSEKRDFSKIIFSAVFVLLIICSSVIITFFATKSFYGSSISGETPYQESALNYSDVMLSKEVHQMFQCVGDFAEKEDAQHFTVVTNTTLTSGKYQLCCYTSNATWTTICVTKVPDSKVKQ